MTTATACLDEGRVLAFLDGTLSEDGRSDVEAHLAACSACAELTTWVAADQAHRSRAPGEEGRPFVGQLSPGARVDRYQILGGVGRGGMGEVYAAYHPDLDRRIALKVVSEAGANAPERRARLLREARAIARLSHPNVVAVYDAGTVDDRVYIAMEFVEGETVDAWLRAKPRRWREILDVFIAAGRGLAAAHAAGIVHRDFKPQNVMIGRDGSVRVMDFGLARLAEEPVEASEDRIDADSRPRPATVTKTGALVGTIAYMAPEQFRGEALDARADQFSFCVALHEALYGNRPALAHLQPAADNDEKGPTASVPAWLRSIVSRGFAETREERFASIDDLIRALVKGRTRPRRRAVGASVGLAVALLAFGGWRAARGGRISCQVPTVRLAAAWSGQDDARRQSIHRAFVETGRPTAETAWQRVSRVLDAHVGKWSAMYVDTCEATHLRGEQSGEVLDLRMACLADNLDQVRALTEALNNATGGAVAQAVAAAQGLPAVSRCADVTLLRSAVPLPRDEPTLKAVRELQSSLREAQAWRDLADLPKAHQHAVALRSKVEATGYGPLLAELLELIGCTSLTDPTTEALLHRALFTAEAAHDDPTAAKVAADLILSAAFRSHDLREAEVWFHLSESILDRLGPGHERTRAWAWNNFGLALPLAGSFDKAEPFARRAVALKEGALGKDHPDVAISLYLLGMVLTENGRPAEGLASADRALEIFQKNDNFDPDHVASLQDTRGTALVALGRTAEAEACFLATSRMYQQDFRASDRQQAFPLQGLGMVRLARGQPRAALPFLEEALRIREAGEPLQYNVAETRFSLARALWESGSDRRRALKLAAQAQHTYATDGYRKHERAVTEWLAEHKGSINR